MSQYRYMRTDTSISDTNIVVVSSFHNQKMTNVIARGSGEDAAAQAAYIAHVDACKSSPPMQTDPSCTSSPIGMWVQTITGAGSPSIVGFDETITVPAGNSGQLMFNITSSVPGGALQYSLNGGTTWTAATNGLVITVTNGQKLRLQALTMASGNNYFGNVTDNSTSIIVDVFQFQHV